MSSLRPSRDSLSRSAACRLARRGAGLYVDMGGDDSDDSLQPPRGGAPSVWTERARRGAWTERDCVFFSVLVVGPAAVRNGAPNVDN